jgi:acetyl-CoA/propionyl-CoA carboxylase carboxyl transferase subunit
MTALTAQPHAGPGDNGQDHRAPVVRLGQLLDLNSIRPLSQDDSTEIWGAGGVQVVRGRINGSEVIAYCTDGSRMGGALGAAEADLIIEAIDAAVRHDCPVIGLWHSGGAKLADGVESMDGVGRMFAAMTRASGRVPQISVVLGPAAGAAAYGPALTDLVIMCDTGRLFVTGPDVVRTVTGEQIDMEGLGGTDAHGRRSGVAHVTVDSEADAYQHARRIVELLARPGTFDPAGVGAGEDLRALLPDSAKRAYDVRPLVRELVDSDENGSPFEEIQAKWAPNMVVGLGRLAGRTIGVLANNPLRKGGCLDSLSAEKAARFVRLCDAFGVPLLVVVDVPGYLPGVGQEWGGVVRRGAKLLHSFAEAEIGRAHV